MNNEFIFIFIFICGKERKGKNFGMLSDAC